MNVYWGSFFLFFTYFMSSWLTLIKALWTWTQWEEAGRRRGFRSSWVLPSNRRNVNRHVGGSSLSFVCWQMHGPTCDGDTKPNSPRNLLQPVAPPPSCHSKVGTRGNGPLGGGGWLRLHYAVKMKWGRGLDWIRRSCFDKWERCQFSLYSCLALNGLHFSLSPFPSSSLSFLPVQVSIGVGKMGHLHASPCLSLPSGLSFSPHWLNILVRGM